MKEKTHNYTYINATIPEYLLKKVKYLRWDTISLKKYYPDTLREFRFLSTITYKPRKYIDSVIEIIAKEYPFYFETTDIHIGMSPYFKNNVMCFNYNIYEINVIDQLVTIIFAKTYEELIALKLKY